MVIPVIHFVGIQPSFSTRLGGSPIPHEPDPAGAIGLVHPVQPGPINNQGTPVNPSQYGPMPATTASLMTNTYPPAAHPMTAIVSMPAGMGVHVWLESVFIFAGLCRWQLCRAMGGSLHV